LLFNSVEFLLFFPAVVALYFLVPFRLRWIVLLVASYYFYMSWRIEYGLLILLSTVVDYTAATHMPDRPQRVRKALLLVSVFSNLGILFTFKYFNFFSRSLGQALGESVYTPVLHDFLLPVGISFYTFQTLGYTIDVYRGVQEPERHFGRFALYVAFFPQLVAGPIERSANLLPQFLARHRVDYDRMTSGLTLMGWGFFKKLVVADRLAPIVDAVYRDPGQYTGVPLIVATYLFGIQIYCDFSGYTDIARGGARVLGYELMLNFRQPYFARSITDFWRRWHISLSTWFRDYVYIPLGGSRVPRWRCQLNLALVFLVSGLWHGAAWTFLIWGALHATYAVIGTVTRDMRGQMAQAIGLDRSPWLLDGLRMFVTVQLVMLAWVFFRAASLSDALYIVAHLFRGLELRGGYGLNFGGAYEVTILGASVATLFAVDAMQESGGARGWFRAQPLPLRWALYYAMVFAVLILGKFGSQEFIYFQF
jgi:alginate O-acetyltransferase complex protein AlgI